MSNIYLEATRLWGEDSQIDKAIEEMAELTQALLKLRKSHDCVKSTKVERYNHVCEEIADVKLVITQLEHIFSSEMIEYYNDTKLKLFMGIMDEYKKKHGID